MGAHLVVINTWEEQVIDEQAPLCRWDVLPIFLPPPVRKGWATGVGQRSGLRWVLLPLFCHVVYFGLRIMRTFKRMTYKKRFDINHNGGEKELTLKQYFVDECFVWMRANNYYLLSPGYD